MQYDQRRWSNSSTLVVYQMPTHQAHQGQHNLAENHNDCRGQQETNQTASRSTSPAEREISSRLVIPCDQNTTHDELLRVSFCANKLSKSAPKCLTKKTMATSSPKTRQLATILYFHRGSRVLPLEVSRSDWTRAAIRLQNFPLLCGPWTSEWRGSELKVSHQEIRSLQLRQAASIICKPCDRALHGWVKNDENTLRIDSLSIVEQRQGPKKSCMNIRRYRVDWILFFT